MISSSIRNHDALEAYPDAIKKTLDYLASHDLAAMGPDVYGIQGKETHAQMFNAVTAGPDTKKAESHEKYLDAQYLVSDKERLGLIKSTRDYQIAEHIKERDLILYQSVEDEGWTESRPDCFYILFPSDIYHPERISGESMRLRKVVARVGAALL